MIQKTKLTLSIQSFPPANHDVASLLVILFRDKIVSRNKIW